MPTPKLNIPNDESTEKGLIVSIFRAAGQDCTNGGISSKYDSGVITGDLVECDVFEPTDTMPEYVIISRDMFSGTYLHAVPKYLLESGKHSMAGGNFLYCSDSRFPSNQPISIHDRVE